MSEPSYLENEPQCDCCGAYSETVKSVCAKPRALSACDACRAHCAPAYHPPCRPRAEISKENTP